MRTSARAILVDAEKRFSQAKIPTPKVDAELLLAHVLEVSRAGISLLQELDDEHRREFERLCQLRQQRIPLQHLTGEQGFRRLVLKVGKGVFIPRPETEILVESVIREIKDLSAPKVLDLCSGSGAIALAIATEIPNSEVIAVELSETAFEYLKQNVNSYQDLLSRVNSKIQIILGDVKDVPLAKNYFDAIVANPPYIPERMVPKEPEVALHDPPLALFSGSDGLELIRLISQRASELLKPGGYLAIEHAELQGDGQTGVPAILKNTEAFEKIEDRNDLNGLSRYSVAKRIYVENF